MYNRFIKKDGEVLLDLTDDSISASDLLEGVTAHNKSGEKVTGTFTLDNELTAQDNLITQIQSALEGKATPSGEDVSAETNAYTNKLATLETAITQLETELQGKASGGSGGGSVETCTVTLISQYGVLHDIFATIYTEGNINCYYGKYIGSAATTTLTIENVVCNSTISFGTAMPIMPAHSINGSAVYHGINSGIWFFGAPSISGENCTITVRDDD